METIDELIYSEFSKVEYSVIGRIANAPIFANNTSVRDNKLCLKAL